MNITESQDFFRDFAPTGRAEKKINDFLLFTETGEEQYKPRLKDGGAN